MNRGRSREIIAMHDRSETPRHIMVVDNDGRLVAELSDSLRAAGYRVTGVASGDAALEGTGEGVDVRQRREDGCGDP